MSKGNEFMNGIQGMLKALGESDSLDKLLENSQLSKQDQKLVSSLFKEFSNSSGLGAESQSKTLELIEKFSGNIASEGKDTIDEVLSKADEATSNPNEKEVIDRLKKIF